MGNLLNMFFGTLRAKILRLWVKVRKVLSPAYLRARVYQAVRNFLNRLLDVRPRNKRDYYGVFSWLVSKRLAFALVVLLGIGAALYISYALPEDFLGSSDGGVATYKYRSIPLKFQKGTVRILARDGHLAYEGSVEDGAATGPGILYDAEGAMVYEGEFGDNKYNGTGTLYYPNGAPEYVGTFTDNLFNGTGSWYRANGAIEYSGGYSMGARTGEGVLYNTVGAQVFQGNFLNNAIVYTDFLARPTGEVSDLYSGQTAVYQSDREFCVTMPEIQAVYSVKDGSNTLENEWTVDRIYVLHSQIPLESGVCSNLRHLRTALGEPLYHGTAWVNLPEAVAWNTLAQEMPKELLPVSVEAEATLENVFSVAGYDRNYQLYLYTYERAGLLYTFYFTQEGETDFVMYAIEKA